MSPDIQNLIDGYLDDSLSSEQIQQLGEWIQADARHARRFASELMMHDRLRNQFLAKEEFAVQPRSEPRIVSPISGAERGWRTRWPLAWATTACLVLLTTFLLWHSSGARSASAAVVELNRIIAANSLALDRTFRISVEETIVADGHTPEHERPPKPSLDGAILDVRGSNQFVLRRKVGPSEFFITGSNGSTSWAVRPDGPVRFSNDLTRFNRDLPGHESSLPINNLHDGLDSLHTAYDLEVLPGDSQQSAGEPDTEPNMWIVAVKKPGFLGPVRVEIRYAAASGQIREMRFVEMPYGPETVTLSMVLIEERELAAGYFDHSTHHAPQRSVEFE